MSEGPVSFGKPVFFLVVLGCAGGGYYAYTHWPAGYEGSGWSVSWPHAWETRLLNDPENPTKVASSGPLSEDVQGGGWAMVFYHGALVWPDMILSHIGGTADKKEEILIDNKRTLIYEYEDNAIRYMGVAVERGDALIYVNIGCTKANFEQFRPIFEKTMKSVRCSR
jgi:hypothetical protein